MEEAVAGKLTRILWVSRHPLEECQGEALRQAFGGIEVISHDRDLNSASEIIDVFVARECDEMVVVLSLHLHADLIQELEERGLSVRPMVAIMRRMRMEGDETIFTFDHFERILRLHMETERV